MAWSYTETGPVTVYAALLLVKGRHQCLKVGSSRAFCDRRAGLRQYGKVVWIHGVWGTRAMEMSLLRYLHTDPDAPCRPARDVFPLNWGRARQVLRWFHRHPNNVRNAIAHLGPNSWEVPA